MSLPATETLTVRAQQDLVRVRQKVREHAIRIGLNLVKQTKIVTAASELARNTVIYGGGGTVSIETVSGVTTGLKLVFEDQGPGIPDLQLALTDGYSSGGGLGLGLSGAKRLVNEFDIDSRPGEGTRIAIVMYK